MSLPHHVTYAYVELSPICLAARQYHKLQYNHIMPCSEVAVTRRMRPKSRETKSLGILLPKFRLLQRL